MLITMHFSRRTRMNLASFTKLERKTQVIAAVIVLVVAVASVWIIQSVTASRVTYQTVPAARGTLVANISATGSVRAAQSAILVWNSGGRVETVNTTIGATVTTDQVLATLAQGSLPKNVILAEADLITAKQNLDDLFQSNSSVAQAMQNLADAKQTVKDAQDDYDFLTRKKRVSDELVNNTLDDMDKAKKQLKSLNYIFRVYYSHLADGNSNKAQMIINLTNSRQKLADVTAKYNWYTSTASAIDVEKSLAALNIAKARQEDAQREMDRLKNGPSAEDLAAAKARVAAALATFNQSKVIAPFNGIVTQAQPLPGDRVASKDIAFRIDNLSRLMVDLEISEVDIVNVTLNQPVTITFDAVPGKTYNGVVSNVNQSADASQGAVNFGVTVTLTDADELVRPGMSAAVVITVKEVASALLVENRAIRMVNGERMVYVLKNGEAVPVSIRLGANADASSEVVGGGLKEGDQIILNPPSAAGNVSPTATATK